MYRQTEDIVLVHTTHNSTIIVEFWVLSIVCLYMTHHAYLMVTNFMGSSYVSDFFLCKNTIHRELYMGSIVSVECVFWLSVLAPLTL